MVTISSKDVKVLFIQPTYAKYRRPLFEKFSTNYSTTFFFIAAAPPIIQDEYHSRFEGSGGSSPKHDPDGRIRHFFFLLNRCIHLIALLSTNKYDVIVTSISLSPPTIISLALSKIKHKKCILWIEEWSQSKSKFLVSKFTFFDLRNFLKRQVFQNVDSIVVEGTAQWKYAISLGVPDKKLFFSNHCGIDYSSVSFENLKQKLRIGENLVILYVGRISEIKGVDVLIKAYSEIERERKDVHLVLIGDGSFRPFCETLVKKLKLEHVLFLGDVVGEALASNYRMADIFVLPSCTRPFGDGWGLVINEAMSVGLPIVTTDAVGAAEDLVKNGFNGYVVKNGDVTELYLALKKILEDELLRKSMGQNSEKLFREFNDFDKMFEGFKQSIEYSLIN